MRLGMEMLLVVLGVGMLCLSAVAEGKQKCSAQLEDEEACTETDYNAYVDCVKRRQKRSMDCEEDDYNDCEGCECNSCVDEDCDGCSSCCESSEIYTCRSRSCCQEACHSRCRTSSCRRNCRHTCNKRVKSNVNLSVAVGGGAAGSGSFHHQGNSSSDIRHNITTVINLNNVINNTNIIDIPINVNNTNLNNITLDSGSSFDYRGSEQPGAPQSNCCKVIGPRQCVPIPMYPFAKCFHYRKNVCGDMCQTSIMHAEPHQVCDQQNECHQQISYIPQPQPRCGYTSAWPYVQCNVQPPNCEGCYQHVVQGGSRPEGCSSNCYESGGYNVGPYPRHGPYYQNDPMAQPYGQMPPPFGQMAENPMENMVQIELPKISGRRSIDHHETDKGVETVEESQSTYVNHKESN